MSSNVLWNEVSQLRRYVMLHKSQQMVSAVFECLSRSQSCMANESLTNLNVSKTTASFV